MIYNRVKAVNFSSDLPGEIHSSLLRHTIVVQFEQTYQAAHLRSEPTLEQLTEWCNHNCSDLFSVNKWSHSAAHFRFFCSADMQKFLQHLQVATDTNLTQQ